MLYLSSQPDTFYYLWQVQLQIFNFVELGISADEIHVLIGYEEVKGLSNEFQKFISTCNDAQFFAYVDSRQEKAYSVSLRPHIIAKHLKTHPGLTEETIFFHDADIIFKERLVLDSYLTDEVWYASDTGSYLNSDYIKQSGGLELFHEMCKVIGISPQLVEDNDDNAGGAQFIFKKSTVEFWQKIEKDCEKMYNLLSIQNSQKGYSYKGNKIQDWCAEMWVLWWNALFFNKKFKIIPELNFCWADNELKSWDESNILHYTGFVARENKSFFRKANYQFFPPFYDDFSEIDHKFCSYPLINLINRYKLSYDSQRANIEDFTFIIVVTQANKDSIENLAAIINWINVYFKTKIIVYQSGNAATLENEQFEANVSYYFENAESTDARNQKQHTVKDLITTQFIAIIKDLVLVSNEQLLKAVKILRAKKADIVIPYDGNTFKIDNLMKTMFSKLFDTSLFEENLGKLIILSSYVQQQESPNLYLFSSEHLKATQVLDYHTLINVERGNEFHLIKHQANVAGNLYHFGFPTR